MSDMKQMLDKAASSADPAIRNMAIRYKAIEAEKSVLDNFFSVYLGVASLSNGHAAGPSAAAAVPRKVPSTRAPRDKEDKLSGFEAAISEIILTHGTPMKLENLHASYQRTHPEDGTTRETFRQRLIKRRGSIQLVARQGYWPISAPLPENPNDNVE